MRVCGKFRSNAPESEQKNAHLKQSRLAGIKPQNGERYHQDRQLQHKEEFLLLNRRKVRVMPHTARSQAGEHPVGGPDG